MWCTLQNWAATGGSHATETEKYFIEKSEKTIFFLLSLHAPTQKGALRKSMSDKCFANDYILFRIMCYSVSSFLDISVLSVGPI